jgi:hypothetical protein
MEHERGISYCSNCGSYIPGNAATAQTETPNALSPSPYKVTTGLVLAIIANVVLEIAAIILSVASIVLETPNPDLSVVQTSSVVTMLISVIALIMGIKSISTYKKAAAAGGKKPIPAFILGIIATVGASALILSCLFVLALLSIV